MDKYHRNFIARANRLARMLRNGDLGTNEAHCVEFWRMCSSCALPADIAIRLYVKAGYKPFAGYPLTKFTLKDFIK